MGRIAIRSMAVISGAFIAVVAALFLLARPAAADGPVPLPPVGPVTSGAHVSASTSTVQVPAYSASAGAQVSVGAGTSPAPSAGTVSVSAPAVTGRVSSTVSPASASPVAARASVSAPAAPVASPVGARTVPGAVAPPVGVSASVAAPPAAAPVQGSVTAGSTSVSLPSSTGSVGHAPAAAPAPAPSVAHPMAPTRSAVASPFSPQLWSGQRRPGATAGVVREGPSGVAPRQGLKRSYGGRRAIVTAPAVPSRAQAVTPHRQHLSLRSTDGAGRPHPALRTASTYRPILPAAEQHGVQPPAASRSPMSIRRQGSGQRRTTRQPAHRGAAPRTRPSRPVVRFHREQLNGETMTTGLRFPAGRAAHPLQTLSITASPAARAGGVVGAGRVYRDSTPGSLPFVLGLAGSGAGPLGTITSSSSTPGAASGLLAALATLLLITSGLLRCRTPLIPSGIPLSNPVPPG